jgi:transcriptional regulator with XRE-family HTH domain
VSEKEDISRRLREEIKRQYGTMKALADAIGRTVQYVNVYVSGVNAPGPKVRELLKNAGLDVAYIMTGRREEPTDSTRREVNRIMSLLDEKGIRTVRELRQRLEREEALQRMLGPDVYQTIVQAASLRDKKEKYALRKKKKR